MSVRFWLEWANRFRLELCLIAGLSLLSAVATLAMPWLAAQVLAGAISNAIKEPLNVDLEKTIIVLVGVLSLLTALNIAAAIFSERASTKILTELRKRIYNHVQMMQLDFHESARSGDVLALTSYEVGNLSDFLANTLANAPAMVLTAFGAILVLFLIDPVMAFIVPAIIPAFYLMAKFAGRRLRGLSSQVRAAEVELIAIAERDLQMLPAIKAFATEEYHRAGFAEAAEKSRELAVKQAQLNAIVGPMMTLLAALAAVGILLLGSEQMALAQGSPGDLFAFMLYAALLTRPVGALANMYSAYQMARGTLNRLEGVLALEIESGHEVGIKIDRAKGAIRFNKVTFGYPEREPVFKGLDLSIDAGQIVALTGENGVGKSTLVKLLLRFYEPEGGDITLDSINLTEYSVQELRRQFGYVPQRALLFNGTVASNIAFGQSPDDCRAAVQKAAELAQAHEFISSLPEGYETTIGDNGLRLSGGQRQRIALARALFRDPPVYILDEATSMYDMDSEAAFVENCIQALKGRTVILITHRPASLALADTVYRIRRDGVSDATVEDGYAPSAAISS